MTIFENAEKWLAACNKTFSIKEVMEMICLYPDSNMCNNGHQVIQFRGEECPICGKKEVWRFIE